MLRRQPKNAFLLKHRLLPASGLLPALCRPLCHPQPATRFRVSAASGSPLLLGQTEGSHGRRRVRRLPLPAPRSLLRPLLEPRLSATGTAPAGSAWPRRRESGLQKGAERQRRGTRKSASAAGLSPASRALAPAPTL